MKAHEVHIGLFGPVIVGLFGSKAWHSLVPCGDAPLGEPGKS